MSNPHDDVYYGKPMWTETRTETPVDEVLRKTHEQLAEAMELLTEARERWMDGRMREPYPDEIIWEYRVLKLEEQT